MSRLSAPHERPALLNALLGIALLLAAGLDILLLVQIGWAAWQRATLAERWQRTQPTSRQALAEAAVAVENAGAVLAALPTDDDVTAFIAALPACAHAQGVTLTELCAQPPDVAVLPERAFRVAAQGSESALPAFLVWLSEAAPEGSRCDSVTLDLAASPPNLELTLHMPIRPSGG
jgi:hypothetical protein